MSLRIMALGLRALCPPGCKMYQHQAAETSFQEREALRIALNQAALNCETHTKCVLEMSQWYFLSLFIQRKPVGTNTVIYIYTYI